MQLRIHTPEVRRSRRLLTVVGAVLATSLALAGCTATTTSKS
ncbi:MAG: hypothetical protein QOD50_1513, partial [Actinomycetota bacterium]|nr:hypothetical protein [Actinomycetota bacterium]